MDDEWGQATLDQDERRTVERFLSLLKERLGGGLLSIWLYGSRARGERPREDSDVDLMVVTRNGLDDARTVNRALFDAAEGEGTNPFLFSAQVADPAWLADRRRIESFFIQEVDRDKIVVHGER